VDPDSLNPDTGFNDQILIKIQLMKYLSFFDQTLLITRLPKRIKERPSFWRSPALKREHTAQFKKRIFFYFCRLFLLSWIRIYNTAFHRPQILTGRHPNAIRPLLFPPAMPPLISSFLSPPSSVRCFKEIWKVGKVGKVGKEGKVGEVGKVGREGLFMPTWSQL
jgi:hypothetical protein